MLGKVAKIASKNAAFEGLRVPGVTIVRTRDQAKYALEKLYKHTDRIHAWDTETIGLDAKTESPVGTGYVICASAFIGPEVNFGTGAKLFIDNFADASGVLEEFKPYFEEAGIFKCWHNYGFDRHVLYNHGIDVKGFGGDTMHMARLANPSRGSNQYSLSKCTSNYSSQISVIQKKLIAELSTFYQSNSEILQNLKDYTKHSKTRVKKSMEELFSYRKTLKSGALSKLTIMPEVEQLHTDTKFVQNWVEYAALDAELTFYLREALATELCSLEVKSEDMTNLHEFYMKYWLPLGETLTDMERRGMKLDLAYLEKIQAQAVNDKNKFKQEFMEWVTKLNPKFISFNPSSTQQMQQLLYAPFTREKKDSSSSDEEDSNPNYVRNQKEFPKLKVFEIENPVKEQGARRTIKLEIEGFGIPVYQRTVSGLPSVDSKALKELAGNPETQNYGKAYDYFASKNQEEKGIEICHALKALLNYKSIETLLVNFIIPLQNKVDQNHRLHYSLNLNTETGRLSAKKPNAQNQPALDKDKYGIRKAFKAEQGRKLIVADYGQLELRVLAHMTNCKSMIQAFESGGDFHSRTAISMYPEIKQAVEEQKVLLEWDSANGEPPAPLLKNAYAAQRKTAKTMNFSLAYGKTAHGFAKDWNCTLEEAAEALKRWYAERKEVEEWQQQVKDLAVSKGYTRTLLGRYRRLTDLVRSKEPSKRKHGLRAAINTPIQGGAADIVNSAMVRINYSEELKELGWKLLLQIHDEVILEGPQETSEQALEIVKKIMENPLDNPLRISLEADAKIADNWYEAK